MVDSILELREGYVAGLRTFRAEEGFFEGHFPGHPVVPAVLLVEGLAQTLAYYALLQQSAPRAFLVGIDRARFRAVVGPGVEVTYEVDVGEERFGVLTGRGRARVGSLKVAEATLKGFAGALGRPLG